MNILALLTSLILIESISSQTTLKPTEYYQNVEILKGPDVYTLYWKHDNEDITFEIHYRQEYKWIMFGIRQENSDYSDLIAGWVNNDGTGHFSDRKSASDPHSLPLVDEIQDWLIKDAYSYSGYKVLKFTRKIRLCDTTSNDLDILTGTQNKIVFSMGYYANDNNGNIKDFGSLSAYFSEVNLLSQTSGPFNCQIKEPTPQFTSKPTGYYTNQVDLVEGVFRFYWNFTSTDLTGEVHCKTSGWIGFGLSPNGGMDQSDVFVGWISNGVTNFTDRFIRGRQVTIDKIQNGQLLYAAELNGYTIFKFTRPLVSCDPEDRSIEAGSPRMIFAYGPADPLPGQDISYHGASTRGSQAVNLISGSVTQETDIPDLEILEISIKNVILPKRSTFYYVNLFEIPKDMIVKRHVLKWEIVLPTINRKNIHHLLIYECESGYKGTPVIPPGNAETNTLFRRYCNSITHGWAVGGDRFTYFPKDTGYPVGGILPDYSYIVPELHYDNPELKIGYIDSVVIRYYMTKSLQKNELGVLTVGAEVYPMALELPPGLDNIGITNYCSKSCISKYLQTTNITIISSIPHTHLAGNKVWTKIIRNGIDIGYLFNNKYYDFNYQEAYLLDPPITINKDDELVTFCNYKTKDRTRITQAGLSTKDEMCYQFLGYYPRRANLKTCVSIPSIKQFGQFMLSLNNSGDIYVPAFDPNSIRDIQRVYLSAIPYLEVFTDKIKNKYIEFYKTNKFLSRCNSNYDFVTEYEPIRALNNYEEPEICKP